VGVFKTEGHALSWIKSRVAKGTVLPADEASVWNEDPHARYAVKRINHDQAYSLLVGTHTNNAENYFSRVPRGEMGHHHHISGAYLLRFAQEAAWLEDSQSPPDAVRQKRPGSAALASGYDFPQASEFHA
jgi:ISXO2-like transposase domain